MKQSMIFLVGFLLSQLSYSQQPGSEIDFGTYNKNYQFKSGKLTGVGLSSEGPVFKKLPNWGNWTKVNSQNMSKSAELTPHPSKTFQGEISSYSLNGEFVLPETNSQDSSFLEMYYTDFVTNADWNLFQEYVRDSIVRRLLAREMNELFLLNSKGSDYDDKFLNWNAKIDWEMKEGNEQYQSFAQMFYPAHERYYCKSEVDARKLTYQYNRMIEECANSGERDLRNCLVSERVPLFRDSTFWIKDTTFSHFSNVEDGLVQLYNSHPFFKNSPVTGITAAQAKAYLQWKQTNHQKALDNQNIKLSVKYELPTSTYVENAQTPFVKVDEFSLVNWQITNAEYLSFVNYVRDSIARRILSEEVDLAYLTPTLNSYDLNEEDESMWNINWQRKIDWKRKTAIPYKDFVDGKTQKIIPEYGILNMMYYPSYEENGDSNLLDKRKLMINQYFYDFKTASIDLPRVPGEQDQISWSENCNQNKVHLINQQPELTYYRGLDRSELGKDLELSEWNKFCESSDVYSHQDRSRFIVRDVLSVYPSVKYREVNRICMKNNVSDEDVWYGQEDSVSFCKLANCENCPQVWDWEIVPKEYDFISNPKALITTISYFQFVAYWRWRIQEKNLPCDCSNPIVAHYIPSEEEFVRIQKGESVTHKEETHAIPSPTFRNVISFYKPEMSFN